MAVHAVGVTAEHAMLIALIVFCLVARARAFVWDWLPFLGVGVMFADMGTLTARGVSAAHTVGPIVIERALLGGNVAAIWLQEHVRTQAAWLDAPLAFVYLTFFAAPVAFGLWLWLRHRERFALFVAAYLCMMAVGYLVGVFFPETPPWLASHAGLLPPVDRVTVSLLNHLGAVGRLYSGADPAPYSAMPALHVAVPSLIAATLIGIAGWRSRWAWLSALYPLTMTFATVYLGEHYVLDGVAGMALGATCYAAVRWAAHAGLVGQRSPRIETGASNVPHIALVGDAARPARVQLRYALARPAACWAGGERGAVSGCGSGRQGAPTPRDGEEGRSVQAHE
jgi:hypothetical protein